jgi:hypothetical protein
MIPRLFLEFKDPIELKLVPGEKDMRALVAYTFKDTHDNLLEKRVHNIDVEVDMTKMSHTVLVCEATRPTFFIIVHGAHSIVVHRIRAAELAGGDLTYGLLDHLFGRQDTKLDVVEIAQIVVIEHCLFFDKQCDLTQF